MAYGKRHLEPPALSAAVAPAPVGPPDRLRSRRGIWHDVGVDADQMTRWKLTSAAVLVGGVVLAGLTELAAQPSTAWLGLPSLIALFAVGCLALRRAIVDRRHLQRSTTAPSTVTGAVQVGRTNSSLRPTVRFTSIDGTAHEVAARFPQRALHEGRQLTVRYDVSAPSWVVADGEDFRRSVRMMRLIAALVVPTSIALIAAIGQLVGA